LALDIGEDLEPDDAQALAGEDQPPPAPALEAPAASTCPRKRLTKDSAADLLEELRHVYEDTVFRKQVAKLARDVRWDKTEFVFHLRKVAMEVQRPILERWGFDASLQGVSEVELALQDHTRGAPGTATGFDGALKEKSDLVTRLLYGEMYEVVFTGALTSPPAAVTSTQGDCLA